ncbi:hypothetical protein A9Q86_04635 [Flavobacteriales bacterium 33_180_T64]|nr:hypothetical protein A9Q86_04635 [Flavobacteriales bacterium 33_180_T64]
MKWSSCILIVICAFINFGYAHDADKAFFVIEQKDNVVVVKAEFPWSIRTAVLRAFPELENSKEQHEFDTAFFSYIKDNFKISNASKALSLVSVREGVSKGHSHQNNYVLTFEGKYFDTVTNTIMCNLKKPQSNYHKLQFEGQHLEYMTTNKVTRFIINSRQESHLKSYKYYYLSILVVCAALFYFKKRKIINF